MADDILLYNTLTRRREALHPGRPDRISIYVCGPTVYNYAHLGNARPAVVFDVLVRLLRDRYVHVDYARNLTDVDDKINAAALAAQVDIGEITARYIAAYHEDMRHLGVLPPDLEPRVTEHIPEIVSLVVKLIALGHAYEAEGHVLFSVDSYPAYGALSGRRPEDMLAGARVEVAPYKRNPLDFVLWKPSDGTQPGWDSPWGRGRPGWHVECTAMIERHLGQTIDIHGGGQDLIFPHHENEIAQGTCAHEGVPYCRMWVHNSFVTVEGQKMSKSIGNVLLVRDLLQAAPGEAIRLALLSTHYRRPLDWTARRLETARHTLWHFYTVLDRHAEVGIDEHAAADDQLRDALHRDLNTPLALTRLHQLIDQLEHAQGEQIREAKGKIIASARLLGLLQQAPSDALASLRRDAMRAEAVTEEWIAQKVTERGEARSNKNFMRADALRKELLESGIVIEDTPAGTVWRREEHIHA